MIPEGARRRNRRGGTFPEVLMSRWWILLSLALPVAGLAPTGAAADTVEAGGARVVEVTVYPDRAEVIREARVNLPAGSSTVEFANLPWRVEPDSLRVSARGVPAALGAVELRQKADEPEESPEFVAAREEVRRLEGVLAALGAETATAKQLREFISSIQATTAQKESEKLAEGRADPASIQAVYTLIRSSLEDLSKEDLARARQRETLAEELKVARAKLAASRPAGSIRSRVAGVEVVAERAGALTLRLAYLAPGASWRPSYKATLDASTGEVSLASEAVVRQSTGEDWTGVGLRLSTASPARGVKPPELTAWLLRPMDMAEKRYKAVASGGVGSPAPMVDAVLEEAEPGDRRDVLAEQVAVVPQAGVVRSSYNVAFEVPGKSDVPADGSDHPGPVRVFAGGGYLGSFPLAETAPRSELTLPFGIDNRIDVERTLLPQERSREGITGKDRRIAYAFRTTLKNLRDRKVRVVLEDRVPVSEDERVRVERGRQTTPGFAEDPERPGVLLWTIEMSPGESRDVLLEYAVRFPRDLVLPGLN
jgi:hypothetical protein